MTHDSYSDLEYEKPLKPAKSQKRKDRRMVSGAVLEEGQGNRLTNFFGKLRGGGGSSVPTNEKDESEYDPPRPVRKRKKICKFLKGVLVVPRLQTDASQGSVPESSWCC